MKLKFKFENIKYAIKITFSAMFLEYEKLKKEIKIN